MAIIRRDTDYAIRALLHLARSDAEAMSCQRIAGACDIPGSFAHKILKKMTSAGLVSSRSGRKGGFQLKKRPEEISLRDVTRCVQGPVSVRECVVDPRACSRSNGCPLRTEWRRLQGDIAEFLGGTTLQDALDALDARSFPAGQSAASSS